MNALPEEERAFWTMALFAGLRRGELRALRWCDVDLNPTVIRVERGWDDYEGEQEPKTYAGRRTVPLAGLVRAELVRHKLRTGRDGESLIFGRTGSLPFVPTTVRARALRAWGWRQIEHETGRREWVKARDDAFEPLTPHEARHCAASYFIACGLNPKQLSVYIGHSDVKTTYNIYGHLMPGDEGQAAKQLDAFLKETA